jgi:hypothetical protein
MALRENYPAPAPEWDMPAIFNIHSHRTHPYRIASIIVGKG